METGGRELVFVYGTLRRGASNHFRIENGEFIAPATLRGRLIRISWYPGLVLDPAGGPVRGEVFAVTAEHLRELDAFEGLAAGEIEGTEYRRVRAAVTLADGGEVEAWVWEWRGVGGGLPEIPGGDWLA